MNNNSVMYALWKCYEPGVWCMWSKYVLFFVVRIYVWCVCIFVCVAHFSLLFSFAGSGPKLSNSYRLMVRSHWRYVIINRHLNIYDDRFDTRLYLWMNIFSMKYVTECLVWRMDYCLKLNFLRNHRWVTCWPTSTCKLNWESKIMIIGIHTSHIHTTYTLSARALSKCFITMVMFKHVRLCYGRCKLHQAM